ncbi:MAG TPA: hypothetical protein VG842_10705 [Sediminibacterium sp.]|nr:hypothetical protein [Sediminibacterium sp.]
MRTIFTLGCLLLAATACKNTPENKPATTASDSTQPHYAYTIEKPDNWDKGNPKNIELSLNALKAFEENRIADCVGFFGDSVRWQSDYVDQKFSKDSLKSFLTMGRASMASMKVQMEDFESVISKDKKDEYVTLWYKQYITDKNGKMDSLGVINDLKLVNGKIVGLDEAIRHYPAKK